MGRGKGWGAALVQELIEAGRLPGDVLGRGRVIHVSALPVPAAGAARPAAPTKRRPMKRARPAAIDLGAPNLPWAFSLAGPPVTKNTGQSPRPGVVIPSKAWRDWFARCVAQVPALRAAGLIGTCSQPIAVQAVFHLNRRHNIGDEDRYLVALGDFLQRSGLVLNDSLIRWRDPADGGGRRRYDAERPRVDVMIAALSPASADGNSLPPAR